MKEKKRTLIYTITALVWFFTPFIFLFCLFYWAGATDNVNVIGGNNFATEHPIQLALCYVGIFGAPALFVIMTTVFIVTAIIDCVGKRRARKQIQP